MAYLITSQNRSPQSHWPTWLRHNGVTNPKWLAVPLVSPKPPDKGADRPGLKQQHRKPEICAKIARRQPPMQ